MIEVSHKRNKVKCAYCKSILKFNIEDIKEQKYDLYKENYIVCPVCKGSTEISTDWTFKM